jgi:membrane associated rhomboid family serine protease
VLHIPSVTPVVTYTLVAAIVAIYAASFLLADLGRTLFDWGKNVPSEVLVWGEYHRLLTAMFLHGSPAHLLFNAYALYVLGTPG